MLYNHATLLREQIKPIINMTFMLLMGKCKCLTTTVVGMDMLKQIISPLLKCTQDITSCQNECFVYYEELVVRFCTNIRQKQVAA